MKTNPHNIICYALIVLFACLYFFKEPSKGETEIVRTQRDSIIAVLMHEQDVKDSIHKHNIDSIRKAFTIRLKADSLNHYKSTNEKIRIKHLNPDDRKLLRDSIFRSAGIQDSPR